MNKIKTGYFVSVSQARMNLYGHYAGGVANSCCNKQAEHLLHDFFLII